MFSLSEDGLLIVVTTKQGWDEHRSHAACWAVLCRLLHTGAIGCSVPLSKMPRGACLKPECRVALQEQQCFRPPCLSGPVQAQWSSWPSSLCVSWMPRKTPTKSHGSCRKIHRHVFTKEQAACSCTISDKNLTIPSKRHHGSQASKCRFSPHFQGQWKASQLRK